MAGDVAAVSIVTALAVCLAAYGWGPVGPTALTRWSIRFDVLVGPDDAATVRRRLRRARGVRWTAVALGVVVSSTPMYMNLIDVERAAATSTPVTGLAWLVIGAAGATLAEVLVVQRPLARSSDLRRRLVTDYVPRRWLVLIAAANAVSLVGASVGAVLDESSVWTWSIAMVSVVISAVAFAALKRIADRPVTDHGARSIDDALRADGAHHVVGAVVALSGMAAVVVVTDLVDSVTIVLLLNVFASASLWCWYWIAVTDRWNVARARHAAGST